MQIGKHGRLAQRYWQTYRPQALAALGGPAEQEEFFYALDLRVTEQIGQLADDLLAQVPATERAQARAAVRAQAAEQVYAEQIYLAKESGTEQREM